MVEWFVASLPIVGAMTYFACFLLALPVVLSLIMELCLSTNAFKRDFIEFLKWRKQQKTDQRFRLTHKVKKENLDEGNDRG